MEMVVLDGLGDLNLHSIALKLGPKDTAVLCCVNRRLRDFSSDEALWRIFFQQDLQLTHPTDPSGNPNDSFRVAYKLWREAFVLYPWPLVKRVKACWDRLKNWMSINFPEALPTLRSGASEHEIQFLESRLAVKLPLSTKLLYRFCDGQQLPNQHFILGSPLGLIGGYCFYDHLINVYLLPLSQVVARTREFVRHLGFSNRSKYIVIASSSTYNQKLFFLNCVTGQIYVGTNNLNTDGEMIPCVSVPPATQRDAMLLWLEEHGRRLDSGIIHLREYRKLRRIDLFPITPPLCSTAVTKGVQIRASAVFVPELTNLQGEAEKYWFAYSIRMNLLQEEYTPNGASAASCQLYWRHWIIRANDVVVSDINAAAVIGQHPLLHPDRREFAYESCTPLPSSPGSIEGAYTFVPGRLTNPVGPPFLVEVAQFPLQLPDYIY